MRSGESVLLQWAQDSAYRFFPLVQSDVFGLTLHPFDLATNKVLALVGRVEARDWVDVIHCAERIQPLGYLAWAACGKDLGFSPASILEHAARSARYSSTELSGLAFEGEAPDGAAAGGPLANPAGGGQGRDRATPSGGSRPLRARARRRAVPGRSGGRRSRPRGRHGSCFTPAGSAARSRRCAARRRGASHGRLRRAEPPGAIAARPGPEPRPPPRDAGAVGAGHRPPRPRAHPPARRHPGPPAPGLPHVERAGPRRLGDGHGGHGVGARKPARARRPARRVRRRLLRPPHGGAGGPHGRRRDEDREGVGRGLHARGGGGGRGGGQAEGRGHRPRRDLDRRPAADGRPRRDRAPARRAPDRGLRHVAGRRAGRDRRLGHRRGLLGLAEVPGLPVGDGPGHPGPARASRR